MTQQTYIRVMFARGTKTPRCGVGLHLELRVIQLRLYTSPSEYWSAGNLAQSARPVEDAAELPEQRRGELGDMRLPARSVGQVEVLVLVKRGGTESGVAGVVVELPGHQPVVGPVGAAAGKRPPLGVPVFRFFPGHATVVHAD